jgi:hypothetical protein
MRWMPGGAVSKRTRQRPGIGEFTFTVWPAAAYAWFWFQWEFTVSQCCPSSSFA